MTKVLVVGTDRAATATLAAALRERGYETIGEHAGRAAAGAAAEGPDVIVVDGHRPVSSDAVAALRTDRVLQSAPVVVITAACMTDADYLGDLTARIKAVLSVPASLRDAWAHAATGEPVDTRVLAELRATDNGAEPSLATLVRTFIGTTTDRLAALRRADARSDVTALTATAHTLRGSSLSLGARGMAALCRRLEALDAASVSCEALPLIEWLEAEFVCVRALLRRKVPEGGSGEAP